MEYLLLLVGFVLLVKGADFFVEGSSSLAKIMKVPSVIIGLTIVAMGTSAPEASVSINAALTGNNDIAISNVVGSNIFNGLVVVGICAFLASFKTNLDILKRDMPLNIVITMILCFMFMDGKLSRIEGLILLAGMAAYIVSMIYSALKNRETGEDCKVLSLPKSIVFMAGGLVDHSDRNITSGACDVHRCNQKGRQRSCTGQCDRIKYFQYSFYPWYVSSNFTTQCVRRIPDGLYHSIDQHSYFVCVGKDKKDNVKMGGRGLCTAVYCIHSISADQVKIAQIWER